MPQGHTFLGQEEQTPSGLKRHLNVIISNPDKDNNFMVVSVTTLRRRADGTPYKNQDLTCILNAGDHPFIKHESWVFYQIAKSMSFMEVFNGLQKGLLIRKEDIAQDVLKRIQAGARVAPSLPKECLHFFAFFDDTPATDSDVPNAPQPAEQSNEEIVDYVVQELKPLFKK
jgi:hypothetical protein